MICFHCHLLVNITVWQREELDEALQGVPRDGAGLLRVEDEPEDADVVAEGGTRGAAARRLHQSEEALLADPAEALAPDKLKHLLI